MTIRGWRKWSVSMTTIVLSAALAATGKLTGEFVTIACATIAAYNASNAFVHRQQGDQ